MTDLDKFAIALDESLVAYDKAHAKNGETKQAAAKVYLQQLEMLASSSPVYENGKPYKILNSKDGIIALMNIYWLEQNGFLQSDDFNGMLFIREERA
jgi:hypothetical protein